MRSKTLPRGWRCRSNTAAWTASNAYGLTNVPSLFLVQPDGKIALSSVGWAKQDFEQLASVAGAPKPMFTAKDAVPETVRDRFVASATYTYKINDMMSMPFSLVYANHASYLGDVDHKLNAHFGISFKMPSQ